MEKIELKPFGELSPTRKCPKCAGDKTEVTYRIAAPFIYPEMLLLSCSTCGFVHGMYHTADYEEEK